MLAKIIAPQITMIEQIIFGIIFSIHPFTTEMFTFSEATLNTNIAVFVGVAGLYVITFDDRRYRAAIVGGCLIFLSLTIYQIVINYCVVALALGLMWRLIADTPTRSNDTQRILRAMLVFSLATIVYLIFALAIGKITHVAPEGRANIDALFHPNTLFHNIWIGLTKTFAPEAAFIPRAISRLTIIALLVSALALLKQATRRGGFWAWWTFVLLVIAALAAIGVGVVSNPAWLVPRVLTGSACFVAGVIFLGWHASNLLTRSVISAVLACLVLGYISVDNKILSDQRRMDQWDRYKANRIIARLEGDPSFPQVKRLAVTQGFWSYPLVLGTSQGDMNISGFWPDRSRLGLFEQATGYRFQPPTNEQNKKADLSCRTAPKWPANGSTMIFGELAVVCLSNSSREN